MLRMAANKFKLALVQLAAGADKSANLRQASELVAQASSAGAQVVSLPECFNSPFGLQYFAEYAEPVPGGESTRRLAELARDHGIYLIGGSVPERDPATGSLYNTCTVHDPQGRLVATHRKVHLFDIDVPGKFTFRESAALSPGDRLTTFDTPWCKVGLGVCYDIRFAEMAQVYCAGRGCQLLVYPAQFNMTTGPHHWQLLAQARALDNQVYVALCAAARDTTASYVCWGHSLCAGPWGDVVASTGPEEATVMVDVDLERLREVRESVPLGRQRRYHDLYGIVDGDDRISLQG